MSNSSEFFVFDATKREMNETNLNASSENSLGPVYHRTIRVAVIACMIAFSVIGNFIVLYKIIANTKRTFLRISVLFLNLAFSDLLVTFFTMTSQLIWEMMDMRWIAGQPFCKIFKILQTFSLASSSYMLVSITIDRHQALVSPLKRRYSAWKLVVGAWIASLFPALPNVFIFKVITRENGHDYCISMFYRNDSVVLRQLYMSYVLLLIFIIPIILLVVLYSHILFTIWIRASILHKDSSQSYSSLPRARRKALILSVVIITTFIVTNLPYVIQELILAFGNPQLLDPTFSAMFPIMSAANSAANPYIYLCFHGSTCFCFTSPKEKMELSRSSHHERKNDFSVSDTAANAGADELRLKKRSAKQISATKVSMI